MYFCTLDADGEWIMEDAEIMKFDRQADALDFLGGEAQVGKFVDCWIRTTWPPDLIYMLPFEPRELCVLKPGQHPGGQEWWVKPLRSIMVPKPLDQTDAPA